jgi:hypothetical protein
MVRTLSALILGAAVCAAGLPSVEAQGEKKSELKGGIEGTLKKADAEKGTLTVTTTDGRDRTFSITDDTTIVGPRGGVVRRGLNDPRFHPGLDITVLASGATATEVHLGYDRKDADESPAAAKTAPGGKAKKAEEADEPKAKSAPTAKSNADTKSGAKGAAAKKAEADEDEDEFPGKIKSADSERRILVVTLLNGKDRSFLLAKDVKVTVKGSASKRGLEDPALKAGIPVTVVTEPGGRKVKEVQVAPAPAAKGKKAG